VTRPKTAVLLVTLPQGPVLAAGGLKGGPSARMRCMITASLRARATLALRMPMRALRSGAPPDCGGAKINLPG
jgi:hypothetical protein